MPNESAPYSSPGAAKPAPRVSVPGLAEMARSGTPIAMLTAYDASFAAIAERAGIDVLLVGDSLGMVIQGHGSTLPVTLDDVLYHTRCVAAGCTRPLIVADLPFGSYQQSPEHAYAAAVSALQAGAHMVKMEGGAWLAPTVAFVTMRGVPVCGHVGLLPQSVNVVGGYRVQAKTESGAAALLADAKALVAAGASLLVVECVPSAVGEWLTRAVSVPVIGIGAGAQCSGQVLVLYDALGIQPGRPARFVRNFLAGRDSVEAALAAYAAAVKDRSFPGAEHSF
ncbi:MAG TPA: 3-methyl-2-oxobutanoate hydroxymethyltransferase [Casimicrobiaceae bacterium]|nr:3-methyl-2-oxobutanoate hydroxymethyltransferase [Casimicrobiaceae bacterium]